MKELKPYEVSNLDPYGRVNSGVQNAAQDLLENNYKAPEQALKEVDFLNSLIELEKNEWEKVLGGDISRDEPIKNPPNWLTPQITHKFDEFGLKLIYMPSFNPIFYPWLSLYKSSPARNLLEFTQSFFPNLRPYEDLTKAQRQDPLIARNIKEDFWKDVRSEKISWPHMYGQWMAVETAPVSTDAVWTRFPLNPVLAISNRGMDFINAATTISGKREEIASNIGISKDQGKARLAYPMEVNLILNRFHIVQNKREWTNEWTKTSFNKNHKQISMGMFSQGGAADVKAEDQIDTGGIGFRVVIDLT